MVELVVKFFRKGVGVFFINSGSECVISLFFDKLGIEIDFRFSVMEYLVIFKRGVGVGGI